MPEEAPVADRVAGLAFVVFGVLVAIRAVGLDIGGWRTPGPGFLPLLAGAAASVLGAGLAFSRTAPRFTGDPQNPGRGKMLGAGILLGGYALGLDRLGFVPVTFVFIVIWLRVLERSPWRVATLVAAAATTAMYGVFIRWLAIPLPAGVLAP